MSIYIFLYFIVICLLLIIGFFFFKKHGNFLYGKYFLLSMIFYSLWLLLYLISFSTTHDKEILLILSRLLYGLSLLSIYSILMFTYYFSSKLTKFTSSKLSIFVLISFLFFFFLSLFTPFIISEMIFDDSLKIFYESFGSLYVLYTIFYLIQLPLFLFFGIKQINQLKSIKKIRFKYIFLGFFILLFLVVLFLAILPILGVWIFQREIILFFIPFIFLSWLSLDKYHFNNIKIGFGKVIIFLSSLFCSIFIVNIIKFYYLNYANNLVVNFWGISRDIYITDLLFGIIFFLIFYNFFNRVFLGDNNLVLFDNKVNNLKKYIPYITNIGELNIFLLNKFNSLFRINYFNIKLYTKKDYDLELYKYFSKDLSRDIFINDIVFIEENKYKFNLSLLNTEVDMICPLKSRM